MCKILLPINPEHVEKILSGRKKYEYRRILPKETVSSIVIYSTAPQMKIVAEVEVVNTYYDFPTKLWNFSKKNSGVSEKFYTDYFSKYMGRKKVVAFELGRIDKFSEPKELSDYNISFPPQSFVYIRSR